MILRKKGRVLQVFGIVLLSSMSRIHAADIEQAEPDMKKPPVGLIEVIEDFESKRMAERYPPSRWKDEERKKYIVGEVTDKAKFGKASMKCYTGKGRVSKSLFEGPRFSTYTLRPEADCITFWARVQGPPVTLHTQFSTDPTGSIHNIIIEGKEWKKYILDFADIVPKLQGMYYTRLRDKFHLGTDFLPDVFIENDILLCPRPTGNSEESIVYIDQIQYENRGSGRMMERRIQTDDTGIRVVGMIDDFESGPGKMLKGEWIRANIKRICRLTDGTYFEEGKPGKRHSWIDTAWRKFSVTGKAKNGKGAARLTANIGDEGHSQVGWDVKNVPDNANGIAFWLKTVSPPKYGRQTMFVHVWCIPEEKQELANTPTPEVNRHFNSDYQWGYNLDLEGGRIDLPRTMYSASIDFKDRDTTKWHRVIIPFRDFSYIWAYKMPKRPIQKNEIVRVAIRNGFKNHYSNADLVIDDLCLVHIEDLKGEPFPSTYPPHAFTSLTASYSTLWKECNVAMNTTTSWQLQLDNPNSKTNRLSTAKRKAAAPPPDGIGIPAADKTIVVDGDVSDWKNIPSMPMPFMKKTSGPVKLCWSNVGLYGALSITDDDIQSNREAPWKADCVECFIQTDGKRPISRDKNSVQIVFAPDTKSGPGKGLILVPNNAIEEADATTICAWQKTEAGYNLEFLITAVRLFPAEMKQGTKLGLNICIDNNGKPAAQFWSDKNTNNGYRSPSTWGQVILKGKK